MKDRGISARTYLIGVFPENFFFECNLYQQAIFNVIANAVKFNKRHGSVQIYLSYNQVANAFETVVEDTGIGIPPEQQKNLFAVFRDKIGGSNKHKLDSTSGVGVGLTNAKIICEALDGYI